MCIRDRGTTGGAGTLLLGKGGADEVANAGGTGGACDEGANEDGNAGADVGGIGAADDFSAEALTFFLEGLEFGMCGLLLGICGVG